MADNDTGALSSLGANDINVTGALSNILNDIANPERQKLAAASAFLAPTHGGGFGESLSGALGSMYSSQVAQDKLKAEYMPHITKALIDAAAFQRQQAMIQAGMNQLQLEANGGVQPIQQPGMPGGGVGEGVQGTSPMGGGQPRSGASSGLMRPGLSPGVAMLGFGMDPKGYVENLVKGFNPADLEKTDAYLGITPKQSRSTTIAERVAKSNGVVIDEFGNAVRVPNYAESIATNEGLKTSAQKQAENANAPLKPSEFQLSGDAAKRPMTVGQYVDAANGASNANSATPVSPQQPSNGTLPSSFVNAVISTESNGNPNAVSPKGARGTMQVMPATLTDPGFGVAPAKNNSPEELTRVGGDYLSALHKKYNDPTITAIAYNMGPGATDKWLDAGGNFGKLPKETQNYVASVATKAAVNSRSQPAATGDIQLKTPTEIAQETATLQLRNKPVLDYQEKRAASVDGLEKSIDQEAKEAADFAKRISNMREVLNFDSNAATPARSRMAEIAQSMGAPKTLVNGVAGGDLASIQQFKKIAVTNSMSALQNDMNNGRITQSEFQIYKDNQPNISMLRDATEGIFAKAQQKNALSLDKQKEFGAYKQKALAEGKVPDNFEQHWNQKLKDSGQILANENKSSKGPMNIHQDSAAQDIKAQLSSGKITREQAVQKLKALGFK